eukprot:4641390-Amphidinium_carterae.1
MLVPGRRPPMLLCTTWLKLRTRHSGSRQAEPRTHNTSQRSNNGLSAVESCYAARPHMLVWDLKCKRVLCSLAQIQGDGNVAKLRCKVPIDRRLQHATTDGTPLWTEVAGDA